MCIIGHDNMFVSQFGCWLDCETMIEILIDAVTILTQETQTIARDLDNIKVVHSTGVRLKATAPGR